MIAIYKHADQFNFSKMKFHDASKRKTCHNKVYRYGNTVTGFHSYVSSFRNRSLLNRRMVLSWHVCSRSVPYLEHFCCRCCVCVAITVWSLYIDEEHRAVCDCPGKYCSLYENTFFITRRRIKYVHVRISECRINCLCHKTRFWTFDVFNPSCHWIYVGNMTISSQSVSFPRLSAILFANSFVCVYSFFNVPFFI